MKITALSLFPEMFAPMEQSIMKRAADNNLLEFSVINFRDFAKSKHKNVDDEPYGGGAGMLLKPEPVFDCIDEVILRDESKNRKIILMTPQGDTFNQSIAKELSGCDHLVFICGHYEGYDERIRTLADMELSIGDYVLTGGELSSMVVMDSVMRLVPGVLGEEESHETDSFSEGLLEHPHYTRPREYRGMTVPFVLLNGNHEEIRKWRRKESLKRTLKRRPELIDSLKLSKEDIKFLEEIRREEI